MLELTSRVESCIPVQYTAPKQSNLFFVTIWVCWRCVGECDGVTSRAQSHMLCFCTYAWILKKRPPYTVAFSKLTSSLPYLAWLNLTKRPKSWSLIYRWTLSSVIRDIRFALKMRTHLLKNRLLLYVCFACQKCSVSPLSSKCFTNEGQI